MFDTPKNLYKKFLGAKGESLTVCRLKEQGYKILEQNYKTRYGEADIIAELNGVIVFVEVKTRSNTKFGVPAEAVNFKKQKRYRDIANSYLLKNGLTDVNVSFAVSEVIGDEINIIENAF